MRKFLTMAFVLAGVALAGFLTTPRAEALTATSPAAAAVLGQSSGLVEDVAYVCRRVKRCGYYGCTWRRVCHHTGPTYRYGYYAPRHRYSYNPRPGRYNTWNGCPGGYTVQDGRCKPYRGY